MKIAVIGSGSWGTAIASLLSSKNYTVHLWSWKKEECEALKRDRENKEFLPGVKLNGSISFTNDMAECVADAELIVMATPSHAVRNTAKTLAACIFPGQIVLNIAKGLEPETLKRLSEVIKDEIPDVRLAVMSGPSHAEEVGRGMATANVVASDDKDISLFIQDVFMGPNFRVYTSDDMRGVEIGGAIKNVIALAAGIAVGLGCGDNTSAALMTRGIAEISRLGVAMGAKAETFAGLTGIGDLIVTCMSTHSRNRRAGVLIGHGKTLKEATDEVHMVVEGVNACSAAYDLAKKYDVSMPITTCVHRVLFEGMPVRESIAMLMGREKRAESEHDVLSGQSL